MSWERRARGGRYYTRSRRKGGRIVREYIGTGPTAEMVARYDALERERLAIERASVSARRAADAELERAVAEADQTAELMARLALIAAGYHRHHGGEWRKRRAAQDD